jgi:hypothetical protein
MKEININKISLPKWSGYHNNNETSLVNKKKKRNLTIHIKSKMAIKQVWRQQYFKSDGHRGLTLCMMFKNNRWTAIS